MNDIDEDVIRCPICDHTLSRDFAISAQVWNCRDCSSVFTPQELAEEWENKEISNPQGTQETDTPASNFL